ncbi:hypothetical protein P615_06390 [Brevibacillus laterosporus PE36]|nr:hypothetical protein P615_06390 [Brevibacillus laterosporus PE36]
MYVAKKFSIRACFYKKSLLKHMFLTGLPNSTKHRQYADTRYFQQEMPSMKKLNILLFIAVVVECFVVTVGGS